MKKYILLTLIAIALISVSCTDYTDPKIISGTIWRCSKFTDSEMAQTYEYVEVHFISETQLQMWEKKKNDYPYQSSGSLSYTISDKTLTIKVPTSQQDVTATIENSELIMSFTNYTLTFTKL